MVTIELQIRARTPELVVRYTIHPKLVCQTGNHGIGTQLEIYPKEQRKSTSESKSRSRACNVMVVDGDDTDDGHTIRRIT